MNCAPSSARGARALPAKADRVQIFSSRLRCPTSTQDQHASLQSQQGGAAHRLEGSIPSPPRASVPSIDLAPEGIDASVRGVLSRVTAAVRRGAAPARPQSVQGERPTEPSTPRRTAPRPPWLFRSREVAEREPPAPPWESSASGAGVDDGACSVAEPSQRPWPSGPWTGASAPKNASNHVGSVGQPRACSP
jgi:hypothetical protein